MEKATLSSLELLSPLPDLFLRPDGTRAASRADWEAHRAELYRTAVGMQYGGMPPEPEFLEVETLYTCDVTCSYRIRTGRRAHPITFVMQVILPAKKADKYPIIVDGDGCFAYVYRDEHLKSWRTISKKTFTRTVCTPCIRTRASARSRHGHGATTAVWTPYCSSASPIRP